MIRIRYVVNIGDLFKTFSGGMFDRNCFSVLTFNKIFSLFENLDHV